MTRGAGCCRHCVMRKPWLCPRLQVPQGLGWDLDLDLWNSKAQVLFCHITGLFSLFCLVSLVFSLLDGEEVTQLLWVSSLTTPLSRPHQSRIKNSATPGEPNDNVHFSKLIHQSYYSTFPVQSRGSTLLPRHGTKMRALVTFLMTLSSNSKLQELGGQRMLGAIHTDKL